MPKAVREIQLPMFGMDTGQIINVAQVQHRSPFRYPGGRTWLVPFIQQWMLSQHKRCVEFIEPFVGGAIIGLTVAFERLANHVTLVELDHQVAAVWKTILEGDYEWLAHNILEFKLTPDSVEEVLGKKAGSRLYTHSELDHEQLFSIVKTLQGNFLMTYDNAPEIQVMVERHGFSTKPVAMKNTHHAEWDGICNR